MRGSSIELQQVSKAFAHHPVVREASFTVASGEFFSLLGPSGCGKTTCLRLIAGFERLDSGCILYDGVESRDAPAYAHIVNLVFQHYALFPHLTVERNVAFGLEMQKLAKTEIHRRVAEALELVQLAGLERRLPHELSGGQQQRVALARAIVTRPSVLLLDEPLGALDLKLRRDMQLELKALQRRLGLTFIHVTHDQDEALAMSDRIAVMHHGRVLQVGTAEDIYERPATRFVAGFIGESNLIEGDASSLQMQAAGVSLRIAHDSARGPATLAIRPERIALAPDAGAADNCLAATVEDSLYLGNDTQYRVRVTSELVLTVREQNRGHAPYRRGDRVYASWRAEAATLVAPDPQA